MKNDKSEVVYFELNNWIAGKHYPSSEPFLSWMHDDLKIQFNDETWVKENKLCVVFSFVDMSQNFCITASRGWVENNCPELLTKYQEFLRFPNKYGNVTGQFGCPFLKYNESNYGINIIHLRWIYNEFGINEKIIRNSIQKR